MGVKYNTISRTILIVECHNYKTLKIRLAYFFKSLFLKMHIFVIFTMKFYITLSHSLLL